MSGTVSNDAVRALAYQLWKERGGQGGTPDEDWRRAEEMLSEDQRAIIQDSALDHVTARGPGSERVKATVGVDRAVDESFPASDPPAVHVKDDPPVNATAKWHAVKKEDAEKKAKGARV